MTGIIIDDEFKTLIPPLTNDEFKQLERNIIEEGCRDSLVLWQGILIDGHNRHKICTKNNILFKTISKSFADREDVKQWIITNQLGRRNLPDFVKYELLESYEEIEKQKGREKYIETVGRPDKSLSTIDNDKFPEPPKHDTRQKVARKLGWSTGKTAQAKIVKEKAKPEIIEKLRKNEVSINQAYKEIKAEEKKVHLEQKKQENLTVLSKEVKENKPMVSLMDCKDYLSTFEDNSIDLLITDPPYSTDIKDINGFIASWIPLALRKVKATGRVYICIGAYPKELQAYINYLLAQDKFILDNPLIWEYKNTLGVTPKMKYNLNYQVILHLYSEKSRQLDTSITNEMFSVQSINAPDGRLGNRHHTWQKPDELALRLIKHSTKENDLVVDCFTCTGTFLLMAAKLNRIAKGCDIDEENLKIAKERGCEIAENI